MCVLLLGGWAAELGISMVWSPRMGRSAELRRGDRHRSGTGGRGAGPTRHARGAEGDWTSCVRGLHDGAPSDGGLYVREE